MAERQQKIPIPENKKDDDQQATASKLKSLDEHRNNNEGGIWNILFENCCQKTNQEELPLVVKPVAEDPITTAPTKVYESVVSRPGPSSITDTLDDISSDSSFEFLEEIPDADQPVNLYDIIPTLRSAFKRLSGRDTTTQHSVKFKMDLRMRHVILIGTGERYNNTDISIDMSLMKEYLSKLFEKYGSTDSYPRIHSLYMPSPRQILHKMGAAVSNITRNEIICVYISAEGGPERKFQLNYMFDTRGLITTSRFDVNRDINKVKHQLLQPGDLAPFTRRPLIVIIQSTAATIFGNLLNYYSSPLVILMAPMTEVPDLTKISSKPGVMTMFLTRPIDALLLMCSREFEDRGKLRRELQKMLNKFHTHAMDLLQGEEATDILKVMTDTACQKILLNFIFCGVAYRLHWLGHTSIFYLPSSLPPISEYIYCNEKLRDILKSIMFLLKIRSVFEKGPV